MADTDIRLDFSEGLLSSMQPSQDPTTEAPQDYPEVRHGFIIGDQPLMLAADVFSELASSTQICAIPDTPAWFAGFINNRGHTVPVYDLQQWLTGSPVDRRKGFYILLFGNQPHTAGVLLDQFPSVLTAPDSLEQLPPAHYSVLSDFARVGYRSQKQTWLEIDHAALLNHLKHNFHQPVAKAEVQDNS